MYITPVCTCLESSLERCWCCAEPAGAAAPVIAPITIAAAEEEAPVKKSKKMKRQSKDTSVHSQDQVVAQKPISAPSLPTESNSWWNSLFRRCCDLAGICMDRVASTSAQPQHVCVPHHVMAQAE